MLVVSWDDNGEGSAPGGRSLSMPLSLDMTEKRVMSDGDMSLGDSPSSKSSCSWMTANCSDVELDRNHLDSPRPVKVFNIHHQHVTLSAIHTHTHILGVRTHASSVMSALVKGTLCIQGPHVGMEGHKHTESTVFCYIVHNHRHLICTVCCFVAVSQHASELVLQERPKAQRNLRWRTCVFRCRYVLTTFFYFGMKIKKNRTICNTFVF